MGKVKMRNVHDGQVYEFDSGPQNSELRKAIDSGDWTQELSPLQTAVKGVSDWAPPLMTTAGTIAGVPGGPAGMVMGGVQGAGLGATTRELGYSAAGIQRDTRPLQTAGRFAYEGAQGILSGLGQGVGTPARPAIAASLMKRAVGSAQPEIEAAMVQEGIPASAAGRRAVAKRIAGLKAEKDAILKWASGENGVRVSWKHIRETIAAERQKAIAADPMSTAGDNALTIALQVARSKASQIRAQLGGILPPGEDAPLTPQQVERIRRFADAKVKYYENIRMGKVATAEPSPMEGAYKALADRMRNILNQMRDPVTGRSLEEINSEIGKFADIGRAVTQTMKRGNGRDLVSAGVGAATATGAGLFSHDPMRAALLGIPGAAAGYATSNPELLSKTAIAMSRPSVARGLATQLPVRIADVYGRMLGLSNPQAQAGAFGTAKPDGSQ